MTRVHVVGTGLVGTSLGLALRRLGDDVTLEDISPTHAALARDLGAGRLPDGPVEPDLVVVATPPDVTAVVRGRGAAPLARRRPSPTSPRSRAPCSTPCGPTAPTSPATAGRTRWPAASAPAPSRAGTTCSTAGPGCSRPPPETDPAVVALVTAVARSAGAAVRTLDPERHDAAVAAVSHVPQLAASLVAARLRGARRGRRRRWPGQGLRDVTRIAASDPDLWTQILAGNAPAVREVLAALRRRPRRRSSAPSTS